VTASPPLATQARDLQLAGHTAAARAVLAELITAVTGVLALEVIINTDQYSLNSLNGSALLADGERYFFKFHSEEGEESTIEEYYNAELLRNSGYDVDVPVFACGEPGRQILLYALRGEQRLADVCRAIELEGATTVSTKTAALADVVIDAQSFRDVNVAERMIATLHEATLEEIAAEPIHQLFWNRLVTPDGSQGFGGRVARFYVGQTFVLGDADAGQIKVDWPTLRDARWVINGIAYRHTLGELFAEAGARLAPSMLADGGAVVAHGDEHNANVWFEPGASPAEGRARLVSFDPAFAGPHLPALLADVKATFHNIYAHPFWLYEPEIATERYSVAARLSGGVIQLDHDYSLSALRQAFLESKAQNIWAPLTAELSARSLLPTDWERVVRLALFCCPTLVLDLRAGGFGRHTPTTSALGFGISIAAGSAPIDGEDDFTRLFAPRKGISRRGAS
jgi:hypothetical protein